MSPFGSRVPVRRGLTLRLSLCLICFLRPAGARPEVAQRRLAAMGTRLDLRVQDVDRATALAASEAAAREVERVENLLSTWKRGGPLDLLNRARPGEPVEIGTELAGLLSQVVAWSARARGAFDPTVLPLLRAWDLRGQGRIPSEAERRSAVEAIGSRHFAIDPNTGEARRLSERAGIDEGAWGKGYALDAAAAALKKAGVCEAVLDLGGQLLVLGRTQAAIADPRRRGVPAVVFSVENASVSTSGNSERGRTVAGRRIGHLLDPRTGKPAPDFGSATAIAPTGLLADVLSTAFFVLGPERGLALSEALRVQGVDQEVVFLVAHERSLEVIASPGARAFLGGDRP